MNFLIVYDRENATQISLQEFDDDLAAIEAYGAAEAEHFDSPHIDTVLLGADSLDAIKLTHASYFVEGHHSAEQLIGMLLADLDQRGALAPSAA